MEEMWGAGFAGSSPPFLGWERAAVDVDVGPENHQRHHHCRSTSTSRLEVATRFRPATSRANGPQLSSALAAAHRGLRCRLALACPRLEQRVTALIEYPEVVHLNSPTSADHARSRQPSNARVPLDDGGSGSGRRSRHRHGGTCDDQALFSCQAPACCSASRMIDLEPFCGAGYLNPTTRCELPQRGEPPELNHLETSRTFPGCSPLPNHDVRPRS